MTKDRKTGRFINENLIKRFFSKVTKSKDCWVWIAQNVNGYGRLRIKGKLKLAHRVIWELKIGRIPKGLDVLHSCDNPSCVNPQHLWLGTHQQNMKDRDKKGRGNNRYTIN